jgi:ABC-type glycerol-3-phosphate transport system substrate-binding protein
VKKTIILIAVACLMILSACSKSGEGGDESASPSASAPPGEKTDINFLVLSGWDKAGLDDVVKAFEAQNPNIHVNLEQQPFDKLFQTVEVKLKAKDKSIDALIVDVPLVANYTLKGYLEPLDSYIDAASKEKLVPSALDAGVYRGKLMALPMNSSTVNLYYNKKILAAKNVEPPAFDIDKRWTWDQTIEAAKKLTYTEGGKQIYGLTFDQVDRVYQILPLAQSISDKPLISEDGLTATGYTNSEAMIKAGQFYYDLFNTWKVSPKIRAEESVNYFTSGKVAFFVGGPWNIPAFKEAGLDFGIAPHPYFNKPVTPTGSWMIGVSKYSEKKEAAARFVEYLTTGEGAKIWFEKNNNLPVVKSLLDDIANNPKFANFPDNAMRLAALEAQKTAVARPKTPGYLEWSSILEQAFSNIKNGSEPKATLDQAAKQIDDQLKKYKQ